MGQIPLFFKWGEKRQPFGTLIRDFYNACFLDINLEVRKGFGLWRLIGKDFDGVEFFFFLGVIFNIDTLFNSYM